MRMISQRNDRIITNYDFMYIIYLHRNNSNLIIISSTMPCRSRMPT